MITKTQKRLKPKTQKELFDRLSEIISDLVVQNIGNGPTSTEIAGVVMEYLIRNKFVNLEN